ncbi:ABC transporter ATP-binding protein [Mycolicibacterium sp. P9-64]|uniref:ABC transporter ATP-binding protein n=1 Tax=Mycolicibacterium sp. P9-64 TaxID=2024612 RepID=UPI001564D536|nr:ABC transporter ATP-binding protein [Mycolicibacterium sp. P9-64]
MTHETVPDAVGDVEGSSQPVGDYALTVSGLRVCLTGGDAIVESTDLRLAKGEIVGLVGESGSGKTSTAMALLGYSGVGVDIVGGELKIGGQPLQMNESMRPSRGSMIAYVPQNPGRALNPSLRIFDAVDDLLKAHRSDRADDVVYGTLDAVGLPRKREFGRRYPHQLSGGQQQRVCIASALVCEPAVIVLDEPTTGLDVVTQARVLDALLRLRDEKDVAMLYVTHDLAVVSQIADRIAIMYAGRIVEQGKTEVLLRAPRHPYTRGLLASIPDHVVPRILEPMPGTAVGVGDRPRGCSFEPRCGQATPLCTESVPELRSISDEQDVRCVHSDLTPAPVLIPLVAPSAVHTPISRPPVLQVENIAAGYSARSETVVAASNVSFTVDRGQCVALVGESGSGKTTIARAIAGLHEISAGQILLDGGKLPQHARRRTSEQRRRIQLVFQNPAEALNPRHTVLDTISRPARVLRGLDTDVTRDVVSKLLDQVRLPQKIARRYPGELSGGERQRVAIARALAAGPEVILCDEITSALDVSVQAAILQLLNDLRGELGVAILFITHNLGVVATIADEVLVLEKGLVCEQGRTSDLLSAPRHPYTRQLFGAAPSIAAALQA